MEKKRTDLCEVSLYEFVEFFERCCFIEFIFVFLKRKPLLVHCWDFQNPWFSCISAKWIHLWLFVQEILEFCGRDWWLVSYLFVVHLHFLFKLGNVFGIEELVGRRVLKWSKNQALYVARCKTQIINCRCVTAFSITKWNPPFCLAIVIRDKIGAVLTFPSCISLREKESMKAWAMTDRQPSICGVFSMSKTNWGFFRMLIQKRSGKLVIRTWEHETS